LKNHVVMVNQQFRRQQDRYPYNDCEIVTLVIQRDELACIPVVDYSKLQK